jgi:hypothetical protein
MAQQRRSLAEIVQHQRRQGDEQPGILDGAAAEMAHIGIQRLAARHRQHDSTQRNKGDPGRVQEHQKRVPGIDGGQDARSVEKRHKAESAQHGEPQQHDGTEQSSYAVCAAILQQEKADQDHQGQRHHQRREGLALHFQTFHRRQHGDGGRQHAVAEEQRQADDRADADSGLDSSRHSGRAMRQRRQRQGAALAVIVGAHDDEDVFDRHHQNQRPENHGERAHHRDMVGQSALGGQHRGAQGIERRGADIAEHHAQRAQHQSEQIAAVIGGGPG